MNEYPSHSLLGNKWLHSWASYKLCSRIVNKMLCWYQFIGKTTTSCVYGSLYIEKLTYGVVIHARKREKKEKQKKIVELWGTEILLLCWCRLLNESIQLHIHFLINWYEQFKYWLVVYSCRSRCLGGCAILKMTLQLQ